MVVSIAPNVRSGDSVTQNLRYIGSMIWPTPSRRSVCCAAAFALLLAVHAGAREDSDRRQARIEAAEQAFGQERHEDVIQLCEQLVAEDPTATDAPLFQAAIVLSRLGTGQLDGSDEALQTMLERYGGRSKWFRSAPTPYDVLAVQQLGYCLLAVAHRHFGVANEGSEAAAGHRQRARALYQAYVEEFPAADDTPLARLRLAELLHAASEFGQAHVLCMAAPDHDDPHTRSCRELAIRAAGRMGHLAGETEPEDGGDKVASPLETWECKQIEAIDRYIVSYATDFRTQEYAYQAAMLLGRHGQQIEAIPRFEAVIEMDPTAPVAERSASSILDAITAAGDWQRLEDTARRFDELEGLGTLERKREFHAVVERAAYRRIEVEHVDRQDWQGAIREFLGYATRFPDGAHADLALYNAIVFCYRLGDLQRAAMLTAELRERFPHSPYLDRLQL